MPEMNKSEEAAFAAMANEEQAATAPAEPESPEQEELEAAAPPSESEADEPEEGAEDEGQIKPPREFVSHKAFHEERTRRQQLEAENRRLSEERARFDERLRVIQEMNQPAPPEKPQWTVDPIAAGEHLEQRLARLEQGGQQWSEQQRLQAEAAQIEKAAEYDATQFAQATPDYRDAYWFWYQSRGNELAALGWSPEVIPGKLLEEERQLAHQGAQQRVSPARTLYAIAKARGFKTGARTNGVDNGHAAAEHIQRVATGQERSRSLSGTGGGAAPVRMTVEQLLSLSKEEFAEWTEKNPRKTARLMGDEPPRRRA